MTAGQLILPTRQHYLVQDRVRLAPLPGREQVYEGKVVEGNPNTCGHVICTSAGMAADKRMVNYQTERVVGTGSFGVVFQAKCLETGETVSSFLPLWARGRLDWQAVLSFLRTAWPGRI